MELDNDFYDDNFTFDMNDTYVEESESCPSTHLSTFNVVCQMIYAVICVIGLLGNTLVIYVVLRYTKMRTVTNMYIVNLAIADVCLLIGIPFLLTTMDFGSWPFGYFMCKAYMISTGVTQFTSSIFLCIISADRYLSVCHPKGASKLRTPFVSLMISAGAWILSVLVMTPILQYTTLIPIVNGMSCNIIWPEHEFGNGQTIFTIYSLILGFAVPLSLITIFYSLIIYKLKTIGPKNKSTQNKQANAKITRLVLTITAVYVMCWLPYWACQVALIYIPPRECTSQIIITVWLIASCLSYSNSAMNPILYAFLSDKFRKSFLKAFTCSAGKYNLNPEDSVIPTKRSDISYSVASVV